MGNIYTEIEELVSRKLNGVEFDTEKAWKRFETRNIRKRNNWRPTVYAISGIAAAVVLFVLLLPMRQTPVSEVGIFADSGKSSVNMPDGSKILLRGGAALRYASDMSSENRKVKFSGDGYFQIKKDSKHPFIVNVGDMDIKVLGTTFSVLENNKETSVSLIEGSVQLTCGQGKSVMLKPGEKAVFNKLSGDIAVFLSDVEADAVWTKDRLSFSNENLIDVCKKLSVWYDRDVFVNGENMEKYLFTFTITNESLNNVLDNMIRVHPEIKHSIIIDN